MSNRIGLEQANKICAAAFTKGAELGLKPLSVAILDAGGHLVAFQRQDGGSTLRLQIAAGKAGGALGLGISSRKIAEMAAERPAFSLPHLDPSPRTGWFQPPGHHRCQRRRLADRSRWRYGRYFRQ